MKSLKDTRPTWVDINLDNLAHNIKEVRRITKKNTLITAVVKANAYGHDSIEASKTFLKNGADRLAVATLSEAIELRIGGIKEVPILILGYTPTSQFKEVIKYDIIPTIYSYEQAEKLSKVVSADKKIKIHIKIDTGMRRIGFEANDESILDILEISKLKNIYIEGIFTHFARADEEDKSFTRLQFTRFKYVTNNLENKGLNIDIKHVSNSAAIIDFPEYDLDMVRAGIILYGLYPSNFVNKDRIKLKIAMSFKTRLSHIKTVSKDEGISYGHTYVTNKKLKIGTIPIGYADGFARILSNNIKLTIKNKKIDLIGRICMDQSMIDISDIDTTKIGDIVIIFSDGKENTNSIDDIANKLNTINYEIVCMVGRRVPRVFYEKEDIVKIKDYNLNGMNA